MEIFEREESLSSAIYFMSLGQPASLEMAVSSIKDNGQTLFFGMPCKDFMERLGDDSELANLVTILGTADDTEKVFNLIYAFKTLGTIVETADFDNVFKQFELLKSYLSNTGRAKLVLLGSLQNLVVSKNTMNADAINDYVFNNTVMVARTLAGEESSYDLKHLSELLDLEITIYPSYQYVRKPMMNKEGEIDLSRTYPVIVAIRHKSLIS